MDHKLVTSIINAMRRGDYSSFEGLPSTERGIIERVLNELQRDGSSPVLEALWGYDYKRKPASIERFLKDDYYLGKVGKSLYPLWIKELSEIHSPYNDIFEVILRGSIGSGKTSVAVISFLFKIHQLICMLNPQSYYGLVDGSPIVFGLFNIYKYLAADTSYIYLSNWTRMSPFFQEAKRASNEMINKKVRGDDEYKSSTISYPNDISIALGAAAIHALGLNLFGGLLDEADMGKNRSISDDERSQVADTYGQVRSRIDSRFLQHGGSNPGILILVSQVRGKHSFLEDHIKKVSTDPHTRLVSYALWEVKSDLFEGSSTFSVAVGDQRVRSYIIGDDAGVELARSKGLQTVEVPEELRSRFEYDIEGAIRDLAGIATYGTNLFLGRREKLFECYHKSTPRSHPFTVDTAVLSIEEDDTVDLVQLFDKPSCMRQHDKVTGSWIPRWYPGADRAIHVDLALKKDCAGISMGCLGDYKSVERFDADGRSYRVTDLSIFIDFVLQIRAAKGSEIDFEKIRSFIFYLNSIGFKVKWVSYDGFQSVDSLQQLIKAHYSAKLLSVDKTAKPYNYLKSVIMETRLDMYEHSTFTREMLELQDRSLDSRLRPAIDHPRLGSKDCSDAVCGVTSRLLEEKLAVQADASPLANSIIDRLTADDSDPNEKLIDPMWVAPKPKANVNPLESLFKPK